MTDREALKDEALHKGVDMRRAQRRYFRAGHGSPEKREALDESLRLEREFDELVKRALSPQESLL